jgi:vacuolar protein sorting-associated protein 53
MSEELPHELLLSIGRILDIKESPETDLLDTIGGQFNVIDIINHYFPDGAYAHSRQCELNHQCRRIIFLEQSLGQLDAVQAQLAQDEQDLREEIARLQDELRLQQGHGSIQLIQEMISVCPDALILCTTL